MPSPLWKLGASELAEAPAAHKRALELRQPLTASSASNTCRFGVSIALRLGVRVATSKLRNVMRRGRLRDPLMTFSSPPSAHSPLRLIHGTHHRVRDETGGQSAWLRYRGHLEVPSNLDSMNSVALFASTSSVPSTCSPMNPYISALVALMSLFQGTVTP